ADTWSHYAILRLHLMDAEAYRRVCRAMQVTFTRPPGMINFGLSSRSYGVTEVMDANRPVALASAATVAWTCALSARAVGSFDPEEKLNQSFGPDHFTEIVKVRPERDPYAGLVRLAQQAAAESPHDYTAARAYGAILYRAGRYEAAVNQLNAAARLRR